jgi:hypothetical protein
LRKHPRIGILAVCKYQSTYCENIFESVANHYRAAGVFTISLMKHGNRTRDRNQGQWFQSSHHPTASGHSEIAELVARAIGRDQANSKSSCADLPPARWLSASWEHPNKPWQCHACSYTVCPRLQPIAGTVRGFHLHGVMSHGGSRVSLSEGKGMGKVGWLATQPGSTVVFNVNGGQHGATVLLATLCSYENVGMADIFLTASDTMMAPLFRPWHSLDMQWAPRSSQQCLAHLGHVAPGKNRLWMRVTSNRTGSTTQRIGNQVKIYGIYVQELGASTRGEKQHCMNAPW